MASWHQQKSGAVLPHESSWSIVSDPPGDCRSVWTEETEEAARARLATWKANGRDIVHSYILAPRPAIVDTATYRKLRRRLDRAERWIDTKRGRNGWASYRTEEAPQYVRAVTNDIRAQVEIYELYRDKPERLSAYASSPNLITTWTGIVIGHYSVISKWRDRYNNETRLLECRLPYLGTYRGRNSGDGMYVNLKRTARNV